jgi:hypothetical protein
MCRLFGEFRQAGIMVRDIEVAQWFLPKQQSSF